MNRKRRPLEPLVAVSSPKRSLNGHHPNPNIDKLQLNDRSSVSSSPTTVNSSMEDSENGSAGTVSKVYVRNFMCHEALEINLNKNVNFIVGRNGSGKSAILTALVVGLAGRASVTNRGKTIKGFIKTGQVTAIVEIVLNNEGPCAYNHSQYGNSISITRQFTIGGSTSYKIKSASGHIISRSGREVERICDALNIQVDNPVCILNQDTSRNFLNSSDPKKKYTLFMRATNLENVMDFYRNISEDRRLVQNSLDTKLEALNELKDQLKIWEQKYNMLLSLDTLKEKLNDLNRERFWGKYHDLKKSVAAITAKNNNDEKAYNEALQKVHGKTEQEDCLQQTIQTVQHEILQIKNEAGNLQAQCEELKEKLSTLREQYNTKCGERQTKQSHTRRQTAQYEHLHREIENLVKSKETLSQKREQQIKDIAEITKLLNDTEAQAITAEMELCQRSTSVGIACENIRKMTDDIKEIETKIGRKTTTIKSNQSGNTLTLYGAYMPRLIKEIELNKNKFSEIPRGPLGHYIKVKDKNWTAAIELFIKRGILQSFCVTNAQDSNLLHKIFSKIIGGQAKPTVYCSKFFHKVHDVSRFKAHPPMGVQCLYDVLEISDPIVANCLIDNLRIEGVLLFPTDEVAMRLMTHASNVPKNCTKGLTPNGDLYFPDPDYKTYAAKMKPAILLQASTADAIRQLQSEIVTLENEKAQLQQQFRYEKRNVQQQKQALDQHEEHVKVLRRTKIQLKQKKASLENQMDPETVSTDVMVSELEELKKIVEEAKREESEIVEECEKLKSMMDAQENTLKDLKESIHIIQNRLEPLQAKKSAEETRYNEFLAGRKMRQAKLQNLQERINKNKTERDKCEAIVQTHLESGENMGVEMSSTRTIQEILNEEREINASIRNINAREENPEHVKQMYEICKHKFEIVSEITDNLSENLSIITKSMQGRLKEYRKLVERVGVTVDRLFHNVLHLRQSTGKITIDHDEQKLSLHVQTQTNCENSGDTRSLSGGERSYATVAFIMALWRCVKFPFYFLDEFDVFMDKVNRRTIMDLLMQHAENNPNSQFVFLTPQDISMLGSANSNITIHRMLDPQRNLD